MRGSGSTRSTTRAMALVLSALVIPALAMVSPPAAASTSLEIHPPEGFTARQSSPDADEVTTYEVTTTSDPDTGCTVDLTPVKGAAGPDQGRINAEAATPDHLAGVKAGLAEQFDVKEIHPFTMQGAVGAMAIGDPKVGAGAIRSSIVVVETPRGKVQVTCISSSGEFDAWRPVFEAVARGVTLPR